LDNPRTITDAPTPVPTRASEREREEVARALRDRAADGRLSLETFASRVERAYGARSRAELDDLLRDLPPRGRATRLAAAAAARLSAFTGSVGAAWRQPRVPRLELPSRGREAVLVIGRAPDCDWVIADHSVSRRHAELRRGPGGWLLRDLGSTNGTRLNGWRVTGPVEVRAGDQLGLGQRSVRISESTT
jgi:FHA domain/Domain of unknown function (DUF1707)